MTDWGGDEYLVRYISGLNADGTVAVTSFDTWNGTGDPNSASSYSSLSDTRKWGPAIAGTGAVISYAFDAASHWTTTEQAAFVAGLHLWQAEAGVSFVAAATQNSADITITRGTEGKAEGYLAGTSSRVGSAMLGRAFDGGVEIDTTKPGFGSIGASFDLYGGYPWMTLEHEIGHALGLGHAGGYDGDGDLVRNGTDDNRAMSIMSYFESDYDWGNHAGYAGEPVTPMPLDIAAIQRVYGLPVNSPLSGGVTFGFNSNIEGDIRQFFDFSVNTRPVVTLWSGGTGNTLDLSSFSVASRGSLLDYTQGGTINAGGLYNNIVIAAGTRIDTIVLGAGNDTFTANGDGDVMMGGAGADVLSGGAGNDHIYGGSMTVTANDGADTLSGGDGGDYIQGNGGNDRIDGGAGDDRLQGGADNDTIAGGDGNDAVNGNRGNDVIDGGYGDDLVRGGQGDDVISGGRGVDIVMGDLGNDRVEGSQGDDRLYGGDGNDVFVFVSTDAKFETNLGWANPYRLNQIMDYQSGVDHLHLDMGVPSRIIDIGPEPDVQAASAVAAAVLAGADNLASNFTELVRTSIGSDTAFFWSNTYGLQGAQIDGMSPSSLTSSDFV